MGLIKESDVKSRFMIQRFLLDYLPVSGLDSEMQHHVIALLHSQGKVFSSAPSNSFTWGEFAFYTYSLLEQEENFANRTGIAATIELLVLATDIMDDLVDRDQKGDFRRILDEPKALILANALLMESFQLFITFLGRECENKLFALFRSLSNANSGQWRDLSFSIGECVPTEQEYFQLIEQKSVSFIRMIFGLFQPERNSILEELSRCIGYSGQLKNDAKDILSKSSSDLLHKKATLPLIKAVEYSLEKDQGLLLEYLAKLDVNRVDDKLVEEIQAYIKKSGAIDYCLILAKLHLNEAKLLLNQHFPGKKQYTDKIIKLLD